MTSITDLRTLLDSTAALLYKIAFLLILLLILVAVTKIAIKLYEFQKRKISFSTYHKAHGLIFGKLHNLICYSKDNAEGHCAVFGGSGVGKTSAVLIPTLQSWNGTSLCIDISGDIERNIHKENKLIYEPERLDTIPYNAFYSIDTLQNEEEKNQALEKLALLLMPDLEPREASANARFFNDEGRKILTASLIALYHIGLDFCEICEKIMSSSYKELFAEIDKTENYNAIQLINSFEGASEQNTAGCKQACDLAIKLFATNHYVKNSIRRPLSYEHSISPDKIEDFNVFFVVSDSKLDLYAPLVHLVVSQALEFFSNRSNHVESTILFCLDEFASFGRLEITSALRKLRKKKIRIMCLTQSLADIDLIYGHDERKAMLNNFAFKLVLSADDTDTQEYFAKLIGHKKSQKQSVSKSDRGQTITKSEMKEYAIEPEELSRLGNHLILIYPGGFKKLKKKYYFKNSLWG